MAGRHGDERLEGEQRLGLASLYGVGAAALRLVRVRGRG